MNAPITKTLTRAKNVTPHIIIATPLPLDYSNTIIINKTTHILTLTYYFRPHATRPNLWVNVSRPVTSHRKPSDRPVSIACALSNRNVIIMNQFVCTLRFDWTWVICSLWWCVCVPDFVCVQVIMDGGWWRIFLNYCSVYVVLWFLS